MSGPTRPLAAMLGVAVVVVAAFATPVGGIGPAATAIGPAEAGVGTAATGRVDWLNTAPTARNDSYALNRTEDVRTLTVGAGAGVLENDSDPDGDNLTVSLVSGPSNGTLTLSADGSFEYTAAEWFVGTDSFIYQVDDGNATDTATVTIAVNAEPVAVAPTDLDGNGTSSDPYVITNASELQAMADDLLANYTLGEDVEAGVTRDWNGGDGFDPVGTNYSTRFNGSFDGAGHTIANLTIRRPSTENIGLFGYTGGEPTIGNLTLAGAAVSGYQEVGTLIGHNFGAVIRNVSASGSVSGEDFYAGGLVGWNGDNGKGGTIWQSNASVDVNGSSAVGGLVGRADGPVRESYATGNVNGTDEVGGLAGQSFDDAIVRSYATGNVNGSTDVGGLVGGNYAPVGQTYATGNVSGNTSVGGLVGYKGAPTVGQSYATGNVSGNESVGGLVGWNRRDTVQRSYATGHVNGSTYVGGLVGRNNGDVNDSYWDVQTTGQSTGAVMDTGGTTSNLVGLDTANMTDYAAVTNMSAFAFASPNTWTATAGDYPVLGWQNAAPTPSADNYTLLVLPTESSRTLSVAAPGVLGNDTDPEGRSLTASLVEGPANGTVSFAANGSFTYTSDDGFAGVDSFTYQVADDDGGLARATVAVSVEPSPTLLNVTVMNGSGTPGDPYVITNATELQAALGAPNASYVLGRDIDLANTTDWFFGKGFVPLGDGEAAFTGTLDGAGHTLSNLSIDRPGETDVGLFGALESGGVVTNLTVADADVRGDERVGAVAGANAGTITRVAAGGTVTGNRSVGGLVGLNNGALDRVYATAAVAGGGRVGGLVGYNLDTVEDAYAAGAVSGSTAVGGLVGESFGGTTADGYWDTNASGQTASAGGTGLTTDEMTGLAATTNMTGLAFNHTWWPVTDPADYPLLAFQTDAFVVGFLDPPAEVTAGSNVSIDVSVENVGGQPGTQTVTLAVNGSTNDSTTVSLAGGADTTVTLTWSTADGTSGDRLLAVSSDDDRTTTVVTVSDLAPLEEWWNYTTAGRTQYASPAVGPDRVFVGGLDDTLYALDRADGSVAWQFNRSGSLVDSSPTYVSGTVYVGSGGGVVYAVNATTGAVEWTYATDAAIVSSPTVVGGTLYVGSNDGTVLALDATSGTKDWALDVGAPVLSDPAVGGGTVFVTNDDGALVALDAATGSQQWVVNTGVRLGHAGPAYADGAVYVAADEVYAVNASDGSIRWQAAHGGASGATPFVENGTVYVGAANGSVTALETATGAVEWTHATGDAVAATPAVVAGRLVVPSTDGSAYLLNASTGAELTSTPLDAPSRSSPTVAGDTAFLGAKSGRVVALANVDGPIGSSSSSTLSTSTPWVPTIGPDPRPRRVAGERRRPANRSTPRGCLPR